MGCGCLSSCKLPPYLTEARLSCSGRTRKVALTLPRRSLDTESSRASSTMAGTFLTILALSGTRERTFVGRRGIPPAWVSTCRDPGFRVLREVDKLASTGSAGGLPWTPPPATQLMRSTVADDPHNLKNAPAGPSRGTRSALFCGCRYLSWLLHLPPRGAFCPHLVVELT
jgi:hypothetical protein